MLVKQSTARNRMILMIDSADHLTGKTGLTLTVTLSKDGAAFAAMGGTVTEVSSGWYKLALNTTDTGTLGDLAIHATGTGADTTDVLDHVVTELPGIVATNNDKTGYSLTQTFPTNFSVLSIDGSGRVDVAKIAGTAQTARDLGASVLISAGTGAGQLDVTTGVIKANLAQILGTALTETAGQIAAGFKKLFNVLTPTAQADNLPLNTDYTAARALKLDNLDAAVTTRMATFTLPTNFNVLSITSGGRVDVGKVSGTTQTARDIGLLVDVAVSTRSAPGDVMGVASGTGANQIDLTAGKVNVGKMNSVVVIGTGVVGDLWRA